MEDTVSLIMEDTVVLIMVFTVFSTNSIPKTLSLS